MDKNIQKGIEERLGQLLAQSPLREDIKKALLNGLDKIPDYFVFDLIDALEKEKIELERIALDIKIFLEQQDQDWKKLEEKQQAVADDIIDEEIKKVEDEVKLQQARNSIN